MSRKSPTSSYFCAIYPTLCVRAAARPGWWWRPAWPVKQSLSMDQPDTSASRGRTDIVSFARGERKIAWQDMIVLALSGVRLSSKGLDLFAILQLDRKEEKKKKSQNKKKKHSALLLKDCVWYKHMVAELKGIRLPCEPEMHRAERFVPGACMLTGSVNAPTHNGEAAKRVRWNKWVFGRLWTQTTWTSDPLG